MVLSTLNIAMMLFLKNEWIALYDDDDMGKTRGMITCQPIPINLRGLECVKCECIKQHDIDMAHISSVGIFSLLEEKSKTNDKVVTGVKLVYSRRVAYIRIQQAHLLKEGKVAADKRWKNTNNLWTLSNSSTYAVDFTSLTRGEHYLPLSWKTRTIYIDDVILPNEYVVTGVRFGGIVESGQVRGVKLGIRGTKYDSSYQLLGGAEEWFDYSSAVPPNNSYNRKREKIELPNIHDPTATGSDQIDGTNYYVLNSVCYSSSTGTFDSVPFYNKDSFETTNDLPLHGLGISFIKGNGYSGAVILKLFPHESLIYTTSTTTTTTPTIRPEIEAPITLRFANTTGPPPKIQEKLKRLRSSPANLSCSGRHEFQTSEKKLALSTMDISFLTDEKNNSGVSICCQLNLIISSLMIYVFFSFNNFCT